MKRLLLLASLFAALTATAQDKPLPKHCKGMTSYNVQCKNLAEPNSDYCKIHNPNVPRCGDNYNGKEGGRTSKGLPCKRKVAKPGLRCWSHSVEKDL